MGDPSNLSFFQEIEFFALVEMGSISTANG